MAGTNNFLPFAPTDTGTNLLSQSDYLAASDRTNGNQPGVASSKLVNKAIRQSAYITANLAQFLANQTGADILDDAVPAKILAQITASIAPLPRAFKSYSTGAGTHNLSYVFFISTGSATTIATYTNNGVTFTVKNTVASGIQIIMTGNGAPTVSGTLTKTSGVGDATLTFYAVRAPVLLKVRMVGGGGGGAGSCLTASNNGGDAGDGNPSTFGSSLITCAGGGAGLGHNQAIAGAPGAVTVNSPAIAVFVYGGSPGGPGCTGSGASGTYAGAGSGNPFAADTQSAPVATASTPGVYGSGGSGAPIAAGASQTGAGGATGGWVYAVIPNPTGSYAYTIGAGGTAGAAGTSGAAGSIGGSGLILIEECYQ